MDISTMNQKFTAVSGWAWNRQTGISELYALTKPGYKTYGLENMAGYYWISRNNSGTSWSMSNCGSLTSAWKGNCAYNCVYSYASSYTLNCCQNGNCGAGDIGMVSNCNNCYTAQCGGVIPLGSYRWNGLFYEYARPGEQWNQCAQCNTYGNCDSGYQLQPNCNCNCSNCNCNCFGAGQCAAIPEPSACSDCTQGG